MANITQQINEIPPFNHSGVLPPYLGDGPGNNPELMSPYKITSPVLVDRFGVSLERIKILEGLLNYRAKLVEIGLTSGFQWLDGSFVENLVGREPRDIDIVTFSCLHSSDNSGFDYKAFFHKHLEYFDKKQVKNNFLCDSFFVDLGGDPRSIVSQTRYWFGLFSHRRESFEWKGLVQLELNTPDLDQAARQRISCLRKEDQK